MDIVFVQTTTHRLFEIKGATSYFQRGTAAISKMDTGGATMSTRPAVVQSSNGGVSKQAPLANNNADDTSDIMRVNSSSGLASWLRTIKSRSHTDLSKHFKRPVPASASVSSAAAAVAAMQAQHRIANDVVIDQPRNYENFNNDNRR